MFLFCSTTKWPYINLTDSLKSAWLAAPNTVKTGYLLLAWKREVKDRDDGHHGRRHVQEKYEPRLRVPGHRFTFNDSHCKNRSKNLAELSFI